MKNTYSRWTTLSMCVLVCALFSACSKDPAPAAPTPTALPPSNSAPAAAAASDSGSPAPAAQAPAAPAAADSTVAGVSFPNANAQTSSHPLYVQPKEPVLKTDGSLRKAFEGTYQ